MQTISYSELIHNTMLKLFISYSHSDEHYVQCFLKHTELLETNGLVKERWYDRNIPAGDNFWDRIEEHLKDRDIVCCFISANYIGSKSCIHELERAVELRDTNGILVVPIIVSPCAWADLEQIKNLLAIPTDGKAISTFDNQDTGWLDVYNQLKTAIESYKSLKDLHFKSEYCDFLEDASLLTKAHGNKNELKMIDIYIDPEIEKKDNVKGNVRESFEKLCSSYQLGDKIAIVGEDQSGKTTLAKQLVKKLRKKGFIPVYVKDEAELLQGDLQSRISRLFNEQYDTSNDLSEYDIKRCVPIIDDFHKAKHTETVISKLSSYNQLIIIVDQIFDLDVLQEKSIVEFDRYLIKQLKPSLRNELIRKWIAISETNESDPEFINNECLLIDERMKAVDEALGKVLSKGIMPSYPFFVLTLLSNYDSINKPLNEEITSQGYCYQALIILFLAKQGVKPENLDTYINFLTEFARERYIRQTPLSQEKFDSFVESYSSIYNMTEQKDILLKRLKASGIIRKSSFGNIDFNYPYLYYFFAGKYFAEHLDDRDSDNKVALEELEMILDNLHKNENAYITIFMIHHSKDKSLIDKITKRADDLFKSYSESTMSRAEMAFFQTEQVKEITIDKSVKPSETRKQELIRRDELEELRQVEEIDEDEESDELSLELRRSMKTVEVLGRILSNRAGSIKKEQLSSIFECGMNVHLRLVTSFFELVQKMIALPNYDDFIKLLLTERNPSLKGDELDKKAKKIFWGINFGFIVGMIKKTSTALGSKNTITISDSVCSKNMTPIKFLIQQDIAMRYAKNLRLDEIKNSESLNMPEVAKRALAYSIAQFCKYNRISDSDRNKLVQWGMSRHLLLQRSNS